MTDFHDLGRGRIQVKVGEAWIDVGAVERAIVQTTEHPESFTYREGCRFDPGTETMIPMIVGSFSVASPLSAGNNLNSNAAGRRREDDSNLVTHSLSSEGYDASEDGTGRGTPVVPVGVDGGDVWFALRATGSHSGDKGDGGMNATMVATSVCMGSDPISSREIAQPQTRRHGDPGVIQRAMEVRRLTPRECERLQGFPDDYTLIDWTSRASKKKIQDDVRKYYERTGLTGADLEAAARHPDGPRYKALGNSMAVNVMSWIGQRIALVDAL